MLSNPLLILAEHAATWRARPVDDMVEHHSRRAVLDWFACLIPGLSRPPVRLLVPVLTTERGKGRAVSYADGCTTSFRHAALLNGVASHTIEFDDIYRDAGYHPAAPTISAALAVAQDRGASLIDFHRAVIAGYEISCRIAMAVQPSHYKYWHTTATVGAFGSATAASLLLGLDQIKIAHAIATAATMTGGLQQAFRGDGMSKPMHAGHAADVGCLAASAAAAGVTGALDVLHGPVGFAAATSEDSGKWKLAVEDFDRPPVITDMTFKNHGCCGHIFAALDAISDLRREQPFEADEVESIHVAGYGATKEVCDRPTISSAQDARFSVQYCIAALLRLGGVRLAAFEPQHIVDPRLRADMAKVTVDIAPDLVAAYPKQRAARVTIRLSDGSVRERFQATRKGDPDAPLSDEELSQKFAELTEPVIGLRRSDALRTKLWFGRELPGHI